MNSSNALDFKEVVRSGLNMKHWHHPLAEIRTTSSVSFEEVIYYISNVLVGSGKPQFQLLINHLKNKRQYKNVEDLSL